MDQGPDFRLAGRKIIAAVAQRPFDNKSGVFCKLYPLFDHFSQTAKFTAESDFRQPGFGDGEIWWMLPAGADQNAVSPGMLIEISLEPALQQGVEKSIYQVAKHDSVKCEPIDPAAGAEIFRFPRETARSANRFKTKKNTVEIQHVPAKKVFAVIEGMVWGPFAAKADPATPGMYSLKASAVRDGKTRLYRIKETDFEQSHKVLRKEISIGLGSLQSRESFATYEYLPPDECRSIDDELLGKWEELDWEPLADKFNRMLNAVKSFTRSDRQQFRDLLRRLEESSELEGMAGELQSASEGVRRLDEDASAALTRLGAALMDCGLVTPERLGRIHEEYRKNWIELNREDLEKAIADLKAEEEEKDAAIARLETQRKRKQEEVNNFKEREFKRVKEDCDKRRAAQDKKLLEERRKWEMQRDREAAELESNKRALVELRNEIQSKTEKNAADCIALLPFVREMFGEMKIQAAAEAKPAAQEAPAAPAAPERRTRAKYELPPSVLSPSPAAKTAVRQVAFLEKLRDYASGLGLSYSKDDVRRFHFSVLCEPLTILEGPSGVGKSSLARIYGDVLCGSKGASPRDGALVVHVSPSWMERADLLGFVNTVTGEYTESETGLYGRLVAAEADFARNGAGSGVYEICLDEMNLAQVEHYFSDFMQILEMPEGKRVLNCFSPDAVSPGAVFAGHASILLPPTLRFVGTVNFDETTRRLSSRLLDRANVVYLGDSARAYSSPRLGGSDPGQGVSWESYSSWIRKSPLPKQIEKALGALDQPLKTLGAGVSPRVRDAMARYVATALPVFGETDERPEAKVFDEQLAQRVLSKVRSITSAAQKRALDAISGVLDSLGGESGSPSRAALARLSSKEHFFGYEG